MALVHVLAGLQRAGEFTLGGLAHLNHRLRGDAANTDEEFCRSAAAALGLPIDVESIDVAARARDEGSSIEAAARAARYEFLERAAARLNADRIAVGHTRDDQAETYLLRLLRGAGPRGLGGIRPRVGNVVRPLIDATRADVIDTCAATTFRGGKTSRTRTSASRATAYGTSSSLFSPRALPRESWTFWRARRPSRRKMQNGSTGLQSKSPRLSS